MLSTVKRKRKMTSPDRADELAGREAPGVGGQLGGHEHAVPRALRARILAHEPPQQLLAAPVQPSRPCHMGNAWLVGWGATGSSHERRPRSASLWPSVSGKPGGQVLLSLGGQMAGYSSVVCPNHSSLPVSLPSPCLQTHRVIIPVGRYDTESQPWRLPIHLVGDPTLRDRQGRTKSSTTVSMPLAAHSCWIYLVCLQGAKFTCIRQGCIPYESAVSKRVTPLDTARLNTSCSSASMLSA